MATFCLCKFFVLSLNKWESRVSKISNNMLTWQSKPWQYSESWLCNSVVVCNGKSLIIHQWELSKVEAMIFIIFGRTAFKMYWKFNGYWVTWHGPDKKIQCRSGLWCCKDHSNTGLLFAKIFHIMFAQEYEKDSTSHKKICTLIDCNTHHLHHNVTWILKLCTWAQN